MQCFQKKKNNKTYTKTRINTGKKPIPGDWELVMLLLDMHMTYGQKFVDTWPSHPDVGHHDNTNVHKATSVRFAKSPDLKPTEHN